MALANTVREYLDSKGVEFKLLTHPHTPSSMRTAEAAHIPGNQMAKSVVLEDDEGYLIAVIPASHRLELEQLSEQLHRRLELASEDELDDLFFDCEPGAVPAVGEAYGIRTVYDDSLSPHADIYFEAGDHTDVVHISGRDFSKLMSGCEHGCISSHS